MLSNSGVPIKAKAAIRGLLPSGLREAISKVRSSVAYAVSAIAHWDWPEAWPQLFTLLMEMLVSGDVNAVHGAMRVLTGKWSNTHTHTEVVHVHPLKSVTVVSSSTRLLLKASYFCLVSHFASFVDREQTWLPQHKACKLLQVNFYFYKVSTATASFSF